MTDRPHILIVDDESKIREPLAQYLSKQGLRVSKAEGAAQARRLLAAHAIDLVVLDIMMPSEDGLSLCRSLRETGETPVILLTARADDADRIVGLEMGADDYVVKPFNPRELLARINAVLRRVHSLPPHVRPPDGQAFAFGDWILKVGERVLVGSDGVGVPLSTGEFNLLLAFVTHPRMVLRRDQLLDITQGRDASPLERTIDNQIWRLRQKIEPNPKEPTFLKTVWGDGYSFTAEVARL